MNCMHGKKSVLLAMLFIFALSTSVFADTFTIKASASPKKGGAISPSGKVTVESGENQQFTIIPNTGYQIKDVIVDKVSQGVVDTYTFTDITQKHSIKAKFIKKTFSVTIAQGGKVSVSPRGKKTVQYGKIVNLKIKPESEDVVPILLVNGKQVDITKKGKVYTYALTPTGDTSVYATSEVEPTLTANTIILDEATAQNLTSISEDGSVLIFTGITPSLESIQVGDVILSNISTDIAPYGLLKKVTSVAIDSSQATIETTQATFEDVIEEGVIIVNQKLVASDMTSFVPLMEGVTLQEPIPGPVAPQRNFCYDVADVVLYDNDGNNNTKNDQITLNGELCIDPSFNAAFGFERCWGIPCGIKKIVLSTEISETISLTLNAQYNYQLVKDIPIATIVFGGVPVGPVVFFPILTLYVSLEGSVSAGITTGVTQSADVTAGISYYDGDWDAIANITNSFEYILPTLKVEAEVGAYAGADFSFMTYGVAGAFTAVKGGFLIEMDPLADPWLVLWGRLLGGAGVRFGIFGFSVERSIELFDNKYYIKHLEGNKPPEIFSMTADPPLVTPGGTSTIKLLASDPDGDPYTCSWSADKGTLSASTGCGNVTWTAPATSATATVSVSVTDDKPRHNPVSKSVTIGMCSYFSIDPTSASYGKLGGSGSFTITAPPGCTWTATVEYQSYIPFDPPPSPWITITSGSSGSGNKTVKYSVPENKSTFKRTAKIIVGGQTFTVDQERGDFDIVCMTCSMSPNSASYGSFGGSGSFNVDVLSSSCPWTASSNDTWITITSGSPGNGDGSVSYSVNENKSSFNRTGTITVLGKTFTVTQEGIGPLPICTLGLSSYSAQYDAPGGSGSVNVTSNLSGCTWSATSNASWITITSGSNGSGNGTVTYSVAANAGLFSRIGTTTIAGKTFTVTQEGIGACNYSFDPTSGSFGKLSASGSITVTATPGCTWSATSNASWITITSGSSGSGNGTVTYSVSYNKSFISRTGAITIAGMEFTVRQAGSY